ncbi:MAG: YicC/YloC family endoribonuclease [Chromatiales bacterium]|jgi:uncharacterized protein (TIGR00255 family)
MTCSMTAFARAESREAQGALVWELRSVNHRFLEVFVRLPDELKALEPRVRERAAARLGRGKLDATLRFRPGGEAAAPVQLNRRVLDQLLAVADQVEKALDTAAPLSIADVLRWPGVIESGEVDLSPVQEAAARALEDALDQLIATRRREGARLAEAVRERCEALRGHVGEVRQRMPVVLEGIRERLRQRLAEVAEELDEARVEQEMVLLTQRLDVDEEMDRLGTHIDEVQRVLSTDEPVGRRLDFLMQELNREVNTLASKSSDAETARRTVEMKVLVEQMREQIQNIE